MSEIMKTEKNEIHQVNVNPENLIAQAIEKGLPAETMEKLLAMRRELKEEVAKEQYYISLSQFQKKCPVIKKESKVDFTGKTGKRTKYEYAGLDSIVSQVRDLLEANGFSYTIKTKQTEKSVMAICESHHVSGYSDSTSFEIPIDYEAYMNAAQKVASALTYAKRYAFCNAFGIMTGDEDDDCQSNSDNGSSNILKNVSQNIDKEKLLAIGFSEKADSERRKNELLEIGRPFQKAMNDEEINFFKGIKNIKTYSEEQYKTDKVKVLEIEKSYKESEVIPEFLLESEKEKDDELPKGVM
jgi:hypothetical protein